MKQYIYIGFIGYILLSLFSGCADDYREGEGEGRLYLSVSVSDKLDVAISKADNVNEWDPAEDCKIAISSAAGVIQRYEGVQSLPEEIWLVSGKYSVAVTAGDSVPAGFDSPYYKGSQEFTISAKQVNQAKVECYLANTLVTPYYTDEFKENITSFQLVVSNTGGGLTFDLSKEGISGYYMMSRTAKNLTWEFKGVAADGEEFSKSGTITNAKARTNYKMNIDFDPSYSDGGGVLIGIEVDDRYSDTNEDHLGIIMPPSISGHEFDIDETIIRLQASDEDIKIWINGSSELKSVLFSMETSVQKAFGLPTNQFDFASMDASMKEQFNSVYGFDCKEQTEDRSLDGKNTVWRMLVTISGEKIAEFDKGFKFSIDMSVEDANGYTKKKMLKVEIAETPVVTLNIDEGTVWTNRATIQGRILMATEDNIYFQYRKLSDLIYQTIDVERDGDIFTSQLTELEAGTQYEYRAVAGSEYADSKYFITENASQLPNASFEDVHTSSNVLYFYPSGGQMFWDSGNKGSSSANTNVTTQSSQYVKDGNYSVELKSQFAGFGSFLGRFAAGNLFAGEYLETLMSSLSDAGGKLSFGREFTSRPVKLTGWYKYTAGTIDYDVNYLPDDIIANGAVKGYTDKASIYVALSDKGEPYTIINTTAKGNTITLFDKNDEHIIAYGEFEQPETTAELDQFVIDLVYRDTTRKPTHIIIVCSASKYGDYFTGSSGSTLWLDDFELIYE